MVFIKKYILYILLSLLIVISVSYYILNNLHDKYDFSNNTFNREEMKGNVYVKGYIYTIKVDKEMGVTDGEKYDYLMFKIMDTESSEFKEFLTEFKGGLLINEDSVGLGCYENKNIKYNNSSAEFGDNDYYLSKKDSKRLMKSTKNKPIVLNLYFGGKTFGKCAPMCYSYVSNIDVLK